MITIKQLATAIEKLYYIQKAILACCESYDGTEELLPIKNIVDFSINYTDCLYAEIIDEQII